MIRFFPYIRWFVVFVFLRRRFWREWHGSIGGVSTFDRWYTAMFWRWLGWLNGWVLVESLFARDFDDKFDLGIRVSEMILFYDPKRTGTKGICFTRLHRTWHRSEVDTAPYRSALVSSKMASWRSLYENKESPFSGGGSSPPWRQMDTKFSVF